MSDFNPISKPAHYAEGRQYETIDVIEDWKLSYRLGNAVKYISRAGRKDASKTVEDLQKAVWYIEREIEALNTKNTARYAVTYEDVLEEYAACAADGSEYTITDSFSLWDDFIGQSEWDTGYSEDYVKPEKIKKDLDKFEDHEIVTTFERRGLIIGVDRKGKTYVLGTEESTQ